MSSELFQRILLATECTDFDAGAERLALAMARRCGRPLAVVMPLVSNAEYEAVAPELAERADRSAAALLAPLRDRARGAGVDIDLRVRRGAETAAEIVDDAIEWRADLLVIRRRGRRSFLAQLLVGEMVGQVLAEAPCDVLVVPRDAGLWARRVLVVAEPAQPGRRLVSLGVAVAAECALPLTMLCRHSGGDPAQQRLAEGLLAEAQRLARRANVAADGELVSGASADRILDAARRHGADLIVIEGGRAGGRAHGSDVAHQVTGLTSCPVLLLRSE